MPQETLHLASNDPRNKSLLHYLASSAQGSPPIAAPNSTGRDPYHSLGSRPDVVEFIWDRINPALPIDCRCLLYGSPALVDPASGIILALAFGTSYILRLPQEVLASFSNSNPRSRLRGKADLPALFGPEWIFGSCSSHESEWCRRLLQEVEPGPCVRTFPPTDHPIS